ncbi:MAG: hypothetical protein S4CHLAM102_08840 [Chlamydiia bacterium]|nr:hypothetical protein [Chlamydiia bacterium]
MLKKLYDWVIGRFSSPEKARPEMNYSSRMPDLVPGGVVRVGRITIAVENLQDATRFCHRYFGLEEVEVVDEEVILQAPKGNFCVALRKRRGEPQSSQEVMMIHIVVDDLNEYIERFEKERVSYTPSRYFGPRAREVQVRLDRYVIALVGSV